MLKRLPRIFITSTLLCFLFASGIAKAGEDITPPQVTAFNISPKVVNTETQDQLVTITATITDDQSGVNQPLISFRPIISNGQYSQAALNRVSGDGLNGVYSGTIVVLKGSRGGAWNVGEFYLSDNIGNRSDLYKEDLEKLFGGGCATFINTATIYDSTPPRISSLSIDRTNINTETGDQTITVTAKVTDDQAGVSCDNDWGEGRGFTVKFRPRKGTQSRFATFNRIAGNDKNGTYRTTVTFPKSSQNGEWFIDNILFSDKIRNYEVYGYYELEERFGKNSAAINNIATVCDSLPPKLTSFRVEPTVINTANQDQEVTITATITDDRTGIASIDDQGREANVTGISMLPLISLQERYVHLVRISGNDKHGIYQGVITFPKGSKEGVWNVSPLRLSDKIGNDQEINADDINSLLPGADTTIVNIADAQSVKIERDWTINTKKTSVTFPKGTIVKKKDGGIFAFYKMMGKEFAMDPDIPTTNLEESPIIALRLGIPGLNLSFSKDVFITFKVGSQYDGFYLQVKSLIEGGEVWANEDMVPIVNGSATFTVNHATRFAGILKDKTPPKIKSFIVPTFSTDQSKYSQFAIKWSGYDQARGSGIAGYQLQYRPNTTKKWSIVHGAKWTTKTSVKFAGKPGTTYYFRLRARDKAKNIGQWSKAKTIVPYDDTQLSYSWGWINTTSSSSYKKTLKYSTEREASASLTFTGKSITLIAPTNKNKGKIDVYIRSKNNDKWSDFIKVSTVDLYSSTSMSRVTIPIRSWARSSRHQVKFVVTSTMNASSEGNQVVIDGIAVQK